MKYYLRYLTLQLIIVSLLSCEKAEKGLSNFNNISSQIRKEYTPDKRVAIFNITISSEKNAIVLKGESDQPKAVEELKQKVLQTGSKLIDSIKILPDESVGETKYAVVNNSVANIRSQDKHSGELATQAVLGTGLRVLKIKGDFFLVQTPDAYISWVDHGGVTLMNQNEYLKWTQASKIIFTSNTGYVYKKNDDSSNKVSDIVLASQLILLSEENNFYKVQYPDKRIGYVKKSESSLYSYWIDKVEPNGELIEAYARDFLGAPYLWGGTSTKGMDCSGFTKTVYLMNGFIIPRDASQQINAGTNIDPDLKFENLKKGDLMFFGKKATADKKQKVTHVGIWLGNGTGEFIHESKQVRISAIDPTSTYYDEKNTKRYLGSRRYLGVKDKLITNLKTDKVLTEIKQ
ncbi:C40 family peptidase [Flavobacteriaceae bacterium AH-315-O20]|nr:C40 family peptidase [Flavobacteriaceae bacterium AH-315-O20]